MSKPRRPTRAARRYRRDWDLSSRLLAVGGAVGAAVGGLSALTLGDRTQLIYAPTCRAAKAPPLAALIKTIFQARVLHHYRAAHVLAECAPHLYIWSAAGIGLGAVLLGGLAAYFGGRQIDSADAGIGRQVARGAAVAREEAQAEHKVSGQGIHIHPRLRISRDRETRGLLLTGSVGSGKTVILKAILQAIFSDPTARVLVHDVKGDYTSEITSVVDKRAVGLLAPWDSRSLRWVACADIRSAVDARELASRLIPTPTSGQPQWAQGAAMILGGLIVSLARETRGSWSWADLQAMIAQPYPDMRSAAVAGAPMCAGLLPEREPTPTTASYLANLTAAAGGLISDLAAADADGRQPFSVRAWLAGRGPRIVVMQGSTRYSSLGQALHGAVIRSISGSLDSMPDSRSRRVWLILDELPQLGKVDLAPIIETGRSKGVCSILGIQDIAQIRDLYGRDTADGWASMLGTHVICRLLGPETQRWASDIVGRRLVRRVTRSASGDASLAGGWQSAKNVTLSEHYAEEDVCRPESFAALGPRKAGIEAMLITGSETVHKLVWPYPRDWHKTVRPHVPARWTETLSRQHAPARPAAPAEGGTAPAHQHDQATADLPLTDLPPDLDLTPASVQQPQIPTASPTASREEHTPTESAGPSASAADALGEALGDLVADHITGGLASMLDAAAEQTGNTSDSAAPAAAGSADDAQPRQLRFRRAAAATDDGAC